MKEFAYLFEKQLQKVSGSEDIQQGWGANLCGRIGARKSNPSVQAGKAATAGRSCEQAPEDNCFLRIHIPFPGSQGSHTEPLETRAKDVVLFE